MTSKATPKFDKQVEHVDERAPQWARGGHHESTSKVDKHLERVDLPCRQMRSTMGARKPPKWTSKVDNHVERVDLPCQRTCSKLGAPTPKSRLPRSINMAPNVDSRSRQTLHQKLTLEVDKLKPVRTPVAILGSLGVCVHVPASRHWLISYSPIHLT